MTTDHHFEPTGTPKKQPEADNLNPTQPTVTNIKSDGAVIEGDVNAGGDVAGRDIVNNVNNVNNVTNVYYQDGVERAETADLLADFEPKPFEPRTLPIPAGEFVMGRERGQGAAAHESPAHMVDLDAFRIGECPVTNGEFAYFLGQTRRSAPPDLGWPGQKPSDVQRDLPVIGVTWYEALDYCKWLSGYTGRLYTLPSEAEWERAARGVDGLLFPWGNDWDATYCNTSGELVTACADFPHNVSPDGCRDMVGNVREWTTTLWGERRTQPDAAYLYPWRKDGRDAVTSRNDMIRRVYRGGVRLQEIPLTATLRGGELPTQRGLQGMRMGFRVVIKKEEATW